MKKEKAFLRAILAGFCALPLLFGAVSCSADADDDDNSGTPTADAGDSSSTNGTGTTTTTPTAPTTTTTTDISPDADIAITASSKPAVVTIYDGETLIDTIKASDETFVTGKDSSTITAINVKDQLITLVDGVVIVKPHTDSNGYSKLEYGKTYTVKFDDVEKLTFTTKASAPTISENTINVGSSASSDFATILGALNYIRKNDSEGGNWTINVAEGSYHERLFYKGNANVTLVGPADSGDSSYGDKAIVYWKNNDAWNSGSRARTNFLWEGKNLTLKNLTFKSTYLRSVDGTSNNDSTEVLYFDSKSYLVAHDCSFLGHQDTLILGNSGGRAWFYNDYIEGDVDFIWGYIDVALFENCKIHMIGDDAEKAYIFASRTVTANEANKGFVLYNCDVTVDEKVASKAYYGRNSGADTQASVINCTFSQAINSALWGGAAGEYAADAVGDVAIGYKDYGNTVSGTTISTSSRLENTYDLSERVVNREYNGRYVILNRGFDKTNNVYKTASNIWDISAYETEFNATTDSSKNNIFIEPVYVAGLVKDKNTTLKAYDVAGNEISEGIAWESDKTDAATVENGVVTSVATEETLVKISASTGSHTDYATVQAIAEVIASTAIDFTAPTSLVLDDSNYITATLTPSKEGKSVTNRTVTWTATGGIKFKDDTNNKAVDTITTSVDASNQTVVGIYADSATAGTITGTVVEDSDVTKTSSSISISDTEKTIGAVPAAGYTFEFIKTDSTSPDNLINGTAKYKGDVNHNIAWTSDKSKVATLLKWDKELTLTDTYLNIKGNGSKGISFSSGKASVTNWNPATDGYDAIKLSGVTGPFKVIANVAGQAGSDRALVIRIGSTDTTHVVTKTDTATAATTPVAYSATYEGTESVDVFITSSNDIRLGSIVLESTSSTTTTTVTVDETLVSEDTFFDLRTLLSSCSTTGSASTGTAGKLSYASMYYKDTQHGAFFYNGSTLSFKVSGACTIYLGKDQYNNTTFDVSDGTNTSALNATASSTLGTNVTSDMSSDSECPSFSYTGTGEATITVSVTGGSGSNYLPAVQVKF